LASWNGSDPESEAFRRLTLIQKIDYLRQRIDFLSSLIFWMTTIGVVLCALMLFGFIYYVDDAVSLSDFR